MGGKRGVLGCSEKMKADIESAASKSDTSEAPYYVRGLALGLLAFLIGIHLWTWVFMLPTFVGGRADFRQLYAAGYMVRTGHASELYNYESQLHFQNQVVSHGDVPLPFIRPAYQALLFVPFSWLRYRTAYLVFLAVNVALLGLCFRLLRPSMNRLAEVYWWLPAAMFLGYLPVAAALMQGQDSILLLALVLLAGVSLGRGRELTAGVLVGLGLFKPQLVLPIALLFFIWRRWRFAAGFAISATLTGSLSIWLVGLAQTRTYARSLVTMGASLAPRPDLLRYPIPVEAMANLRGLIFGLVGGHFSAFWIQTATIVLSGLALGWVAASGFKKRGGRDALLLAITTSSVVSYYLLIHDLTILLFPIAVTLNRFVGAEASGDKAGRRIARAAALLLAAPVCFSYIPDHFYVVALPLMVFLFAVLSASNQRLLAASVGESTVSSPRPHVSRSRRIPTAPDLSF